MDYFYKYTSINEQDKNWQLYLNVVGKFQYLPHSQYPAATHPSSYYFSWEKGRIIDEYQIIYITKGKGVYETKKARHSVSAGSVIIIRKGEWHRYRPLKEYGWTENYIGFDGQLADFFLEQQEALRHIDCADLGEQEVLIDTFHKIFDLVKNENPCFQQVASGLIIKLLGYILALESNKSFAGNEMEAIIQEICSQTREHTEEEYDFEKLTKNYTFSSSHLRKMFKQYTGKSPHQYYLDIKITRAKELISNTTMSIKQIASELGFESIHYFSRFFKSKVGQSPSAFRR